MKAIKQYASCAEAESGYEMFSAKPTPSPLISAQRNLTDVPLKEKVGILLVNLGTPDAPSYWAIRRYLKEFLSDSRVIEAPRILWWPVLYFFILTIRPFTKRKAYESIWNYVLNESPLKLITASQAQHLPEWLKALLDTESLQRIHREAEPPLASNFFPELNLSIQWGMRYGEPSLKRQLHALMEEKCTRILVVPLYPQYAAATTATVGDEIFACFKKMRYQPALRILPPYYAHSLYIQALARSIQETSLSFSQPPEKILASFHGLPKTMCFKGDPYYSHCQETMRLLRQKLNMTPEECLVSFQSRFGPSAWLEPATIKTIEALARQGIQRLLVFMPGFSADCLETLEEIGLEAAETFYHHGGKEFVCAPCLNDHPFAMALLARLIREDLRGWL